LFKFLTVYRTAQYSDWLRTGKIKFRSSMPNRCTDVFLCILSKPKLWPIQPFNQYVYWKIYPGKNRPSA